MAARLLFVSEFHVTAGIDLHLLKCLGGRRHAVVAERRIVGVLLAVFRSKGHLLSIARERAILLSVSRSISLSGTSVYLRPMPRVPPQATLANATLYRIFCLVEVIAIGIPELPSADVGFVLTELPTA